MSFKEGTRVYAAILDDPRWAKRIAEEIDPDNPTRPGLVDYNRVAREIHNLQVQVVSLHRTMAGDQDGKIPLPPVPVYPTEKFRDDIEADDDAAFWTDLLRENPDVGIGSPEWS